MIKNGEGAGIRYTLIVAVLIFTSMEIATWLVFRVLKSRFTFEDPAQYLVSDDELDRIIYGYDAALGWKTVYATSHGERPRRRQYDTTQILTFGDSFTHGDEVADGETWQEHLAERLRSNVFNFGNGAYGTDQAYLRFSETPEIKTKYILLGLITENINRTVNVYRKFYKPNTGFPLTKPRYILEGNRIDLLENPVRSISELPKLQDAYFIRRIGQYDYWYKRNRFPSFSFPYSKLVFNSQIWREAIYGKVGDEIDITSKSNPRALWQETEPTRIMFYLFDRFVADVTSLGATPVIVIFPLRYQIKNKISQEFDRLSNRENFELLRAKEIYLFQSYRPHVSASKISW